MHTLLANSTPIEPKQAEDLRALFTSPGYAVLREIIAGHCAAAQVQFMNTSLYDNENAAAQGKEFLERAIQFNAALDVIDLVAASEEKWVRTQVETKR